MASAPKPVNKKSGPPVIQEKPDKEKQKKGSLMVLSMVAVIGIVFLLWALWPKQEVPKQQLAAAPVTMNYQRKVCPDAWQHDIHEPPDDHFIVKLHEGCFYGKVYLPAGWNGWDYQAIGDDPTWWVAFWPEGYQDPIGPSNRYAHANFMYLPMRFQGKEGQEIMIYALGGPAVTQKPRSPSPQAENLPAEQKRFCTMAEENETGDFSEKNDPNFEFVTPLHEGCFVGPYTVPKNWTKFAPDKSQDKGDRAANWCKGRDEPSKIHPAGEAFTNSDFENCGTFYLQGKGSITFRKWVKP